MKEQTSAFISYSWDSEEHNKWVTKLACELINNGIEVLLDKFEVFAGSNLEKYMSDGLTSAKWIICVCSDGYNIKTNIEETGVGQETQLIQKLELNEYVVPILKNNSKKELSKHFKGKCYIDFDNNEYINVLQELIERIYGTKQKLKPSLGKNPYEKPVVHPRIIEANIASTTFISPGLEGKVSFDYSNNNGKFTIGSGDFAFDTEWSKASSVSIYAYNDASNIEKIALLKSSKIDTFKGTEGLNFTSRCRSPKIGDIIVWINKNGYTAITEITSIKDDSRNDDVDNLEFLYKIFTTHI